MKNIFIAGGAGYIGSACTEYMLNKGYQVTVFDSLVTGHEKAVDKRATFIRGDLADREKLIEIFRNGSFDAVMHFAAFSQQTCQRDQSCRRRRGRQGSGVCVFQYRRDLRRTQGNSDQ